MDNEIANYLAKVDAKKATNQQTGNGPKSTGNGSLLYGTAYPITVIKLKQYISPATLYI